MKKKKKKMEAEMEDEEETDDQDNEERPAWFLLFTSGKEGSDGKSK